MREIEIQLEIVEQWRAMINLITWMAKFIHLFGSYGNDDDARNSEMFCDPGSL